MSISRSEEDDSSNVRWYEQSPLTVLKLSNNEIDHLDEELGGLTDLENLDVHCNCLSTIPLSISNLASLTILNFSSNQLEGSVPLPILNLEHLVNLDLSNNMLTALWSEDWRSQLKDCLANKPSEADDSFNTESSQGDDFWSTFPSSPVKQRSGTTQEALTPFPALRILNLSHNRLPTNALTVLPSSLVQLDLSSNALFTTLPPFYFEELEALNLSSNELPDTVFHPTSALPKLNSLDLSNNAINTLAPLEALFGSINYLSIPPALTKMIKPTSSKLSIRISGNVLAAEPARRRQLRNQAAAFPILPPQQSQPIRVAAASDDSYKTAESGDDLPAELAKLELSSKAFPYAEEIHNGQLDLSGRGMELFPTGEKCEGEVKSLILAKNGLKDVSMPALESWGLFVGLQKLDLSRNRITTFEEAGTFEALASLDLSANRLALPDIFDIISRTAPNIKSLDLTYNVLDNLEGVQPLLLRKGGGLRSLKLSGNRFADVSPLTEVAVQIKAGASGWACEEIDLRDNEIGKLHPELGWLPLSSFQVEGESNTCTHSDRCVTWCRHTQATCFVFRSEEYGRLAEQQACCSG